MSDTWYVFVLLIITCIVLLGSMVAIWNTSPYRWLLLNLLLLLVGDICLIMANFSFALELSPSYTLAHPTELKLMMSSLGIYSLAQNLFYWFFGFEYWHVAVSPPELKGYELNEKWTDSKIKTIYYIGIVCNTVPCLLLGYFEWALGQSIYNKYDQNITIPEGDKRAVYGLQYVVFILALVSTGFLSDALRRVG